MKDKKELTLTDFGQRGDYVSGDENNERACLWFKEVSVKEFITLISKIKCPIKPDCMAHKYRIQGFKMALLELNHNINKYAGDAFCTKGEQNG